MIKHIVMHKFYDEVDSETRTTAIEMLQELPLKMQDFEFLEWDVREDVGKDFGGKITGI